MILSAAGLAPAAVFAGVVVALNKAYLLALGAELTFVQAVCVITGAPFKFAAHTFGAVVCTAAAHMAVAANILFAELVSFAAVDAKPAFLAELFGIGAEAFVAACTVQMLLYKTIVAVEIIACRTAVAVVVPYGDTFAAACAVYLFIAVFVNAFPAYAAGITDIIYELEFLAHHAKLFAVKIVCKGSEHGIIGQYPSDNSKHQYKRSQQTEQPFFGFLHSFSSLFSNLIIV